MSDNPEKPEDPVEVRRLRIQRARQRRAHRARTRNATLEGSSLTTTTSTETSLVGSAATQSLAARGSSTPQSSVSTFTPQPWPGMGTPLKLLMESRRSRRRGFLMRLGIFCGLPTFFTLFYMLVIASPRYVSEFEITYQSYQPQQSLSAGLVQNILGTTQGSSVDLSQILYEYIRSKSLMTKLDEELQLKDYYSNRHVDFLSRMSPKANLQTFLSYYNWYVSVSQGAGGYLTVDVEAFDPDYATKLSKAIIKAVDDMIDGLTARARADEVKFAESQVTDAQNKLRLARVALTEFQNLHGDINPQGSANQLSGIVGQIEGELSTQRTSLAAVKSLGPNSPQVTNINTRISALEDQLRREKQRLAGPGKDGESGAGYSDLLNKYSALQLDQEFAQTAYTAAMQGLAVARADAASKQNYVVDFAPPHTPDRPGMGMVLQYAGTVLIITLVLFGLGSLIAGAMKDQAGL
jgi:capsular polysaccharide transport system permease protein